jgi:hypothetical protein
MKKLVLVLLLVALLLSFTLSVAFAGAALEDPCPKGWGDGHANDNACRPSSPPGFGHGKAGDNWVFP